MTRTAVATAEPALCVFKGCQAGGVILDRAPRVETVFIGEEKLSWHPGCLEALRRLQARRSS